MSRVSIQAEKRRPRLERWRIATMMEIVVLALLAAMAFTVGLVMRGVFG